MPEGEGDDGLISVVEIISLAAMLLIARRDAIDLFANTCHKIEYKQLIDSRAN